MEPGSFFDAWRRLGRGTRIFTALLLGLVLMALAQTLIPAAQDASETTLATPPRSTLAKKEEELPRKALKEDDPPPPPPPPTPPKPVAAAQPAALPKTDSPVPSAARQRCSAAFLDGVGTYLRAPKSQKLVWSCDAGMCGGLGDRFKGLFSTFLVALLLEREYYIAHANPVQLSEYLVPAGSVLWNTNVPKRGHVVRVIDRPPDKGYDIFSSWGDESVVRLETNQDLLAFLHTIPRLNAKLAQLGIDASCTDLSCLLGCLYPILFRLHPSLQAQADAIRSAHPLYVAVQVRAGGKAVTWSDPLRTSLPVIRHQFDLVAQSVAARGARCGVFLTTDSQSVVSEARARFGELLFEVPGPVTHIERSPAAEARQGFAKTIMDHFLIGEASTAVISNSGFSYTAVWRTRVNSTVLRMNRARTGYFIEQHGFPPQPFTVWDIQTMGSFIKLS